VTAKRANVPRPTSHVIQNERGTILKKWTNRVPVCVVFPNSYYIGMSNLAVHLLYERLNRYDEIVCERVFLDEEGNALSVESRRPLNAFEVIFFTLSFEMDYPNILRILREGGVKEEAAERQEDAPIVVGGGVCAMANPEPLAPFFDLFILGDVETCLEPFVERFLEKRDRGRTEVIDALSQWEWVYNPRHLSVSYGEDGTIAAFDPSSFHVKTARYRGTDLASSVIESPDTEFADMALVEGTRGCPSQCSFCLAGHLYPFIYDKLENLATQANDVGIIGGGVSYHPLLEDITRRVQAGGGQIHLPSLRLDEVPLDVIDLLKDSVKTLTFGIEAGSEHLRKHIGKPITDMEIFERIEAMADLKSFHFKFYFMIGLPTEERSDVEAIVDLIKHILHLLVKKGSPKGRIGSITIHASPFVPKAATPFERLPMVDMRGLKDKVNFLKRELGKVANTHFTHESIKHSFIQAVFARGDRRLKDVIRRFSQGDSLTTIMKDSPVNLNFYVARERSLDEILPWDFISKENKPKQ
jgi:radical SAM superfamily enzyme YgiQ (UPF0313 family)